MNNAVCGKTMKNVRNRIDARLVSNEKDYLKQTSKPNQKIFDNDLVTICKSKFTLTLNKSAYVGMCVLDFGKLLMHEYHYDYFKSKNGNKSRPSFTDADSQMYGIKTDFIKILVSIKRFSNYLVKSKYYDDSNKLVVDKMKDETEMFVFEQVMNLLD